MAAYDWRAEEIKRLQASLETDTYVVKGVLCWSSCKAREDRPVPMDVFKDAAVTPPAGQQAACDAHATAFFAAYRESMANHVHSHEELSEMRAAFGAGATVVNVITGKRTKL